MVTIMAMARGLSSEVKGTSRFHSKTAAASDASGPSLSSLTCRVGRQHRYAVWPVLTPLSLAHSNPLCHQQRHLFSLHSESHTLFVQ